MKIHQCIHATRTMNKIFQDFQYGKGILYIMLRESKGLKATPKHEQKKNFDFKKKIFTHWKYYCWMKQRLLFSLFLERLYGCDGVVFMMSTEKLCFKST